MKAIAHTRWMGGGKRRQGMFCESREKGGKWPCHAEDRLRVFGRGERGETNPGSRRRELLAPLSAGATTTHSRHRVSARPTRRSRPKGTTKGTQARSQGARRK